ncbi:TetR/AcrR family transcriptional regulator [Micromonospora yasonensis]|uniref:TetR/AcrR family transcriptional regulator n=1 Tax=Micromonospora yasonensis TaxID=1128667 RepID=UPI00222F7742|nr:TetR/AcrR family transcriptional regulator [Micromonospora yasonensis]MCW3839097.1 TetR/AcrR family transcriptional regulator [Micromonospora yasonensis]
MPGQDRRVRRSQRLLREALVALIPEKGYDRITVQDILDRADVGRSTFYSHYRDKDDLLLAGFDDLRTDLKRDLDALSPGVPPHPTSPTGVIFAHAYRHRDLYKALCGRRGGTVAQRHLHRLVSDLLRDHLRPHIETAGSDLPVDVAAAFYTSAALGMLTWWVDQDFRPGPAALASIYQRLAAPGLLAALAAPASTPPSSIEKHTGTSHGRPAPG